MSTRHRRGYSLIEVLLSASIFMIVLIPVILMFMSANRQSHSAWRRLQVGLYGQTLVESLQQGTAADFPIPAGAAIVDLLALAAATPGEPGSTWSTIQGRLTPGPDLGFEVRRTVSSSPIVEPGPAGSPPRPAGLKHVVTLTYQQLPNVPESEIDLTFTGLSTLEEGRP